MEESDPESREPEEQEKNGETEEAPITFKDLVCDM